METKMNEVSRQANVASELNQAFARRAMRWKRLRLGIAVILCGTGIVFAFLDSVALFAAPLFIGAFIAYVLYLDARDQAREAKSRVWGSATPRISNLASVSRGHTTDDFKTQK